MSTIQIKTPSPEQSLPLVKEALENGKKLTRDSLAISEGRIMTLVQQLGVTVEQVLEGVVTRGEENEQDLLDLEGELELRRTLQDTLWPAAGFNDTELGVSLKPEVYHGATQVYARV